MMDYEQMVSGPTPPVRNEVAATGANYTGAVQPDPNVVVQQLMQPAKSPEDKIQRRGLWERLAQKIESDPNLKNAMMFMGAQMMQPAAPGQSAGGQLGQAAMTGVNAYKMGEYSQYQQGQEEEESARKGRESDASIAASQATTARTKQTTKHEGETQPLSLDKLRLDISKAQTAEEVAKIERDLAKRQAKILESIPDATLRAAKMAEFEKVTTEIGEAKARTRNYEAAASLTGQRTAKEKLEVEALSKLEDKELLQFISKTGAYGSSSTSGVVQQASLWKEIYGALPSDDVDKVGRTEAQYVKHMLLQGKEQDLVKSYSTLSMTLPANHPILLELEGLVSAQLAAKKRQAGPAKPGEPKAKDAAVPEAAVTSKATGKQYVPTMIDGVVHLKETPGAVKGTIKR